MDRMKKEAVTGQFTLPFRHSPGEIEWYHWNRQYVGGVRGRAAPALILGSIMVGISVRRTSRLLSSSYRQAGLPNIGTDYKLLAFCSS
jgi:hypothetical protein